MKRVLEVEQFELKKKVQVRLDKLTFAEIAEITESEVISGHEGLERVFSKFYIGAMTIENITRYLNKKATFSLLETGKISSY